MRDKMTTARACRGLAALVLGATTVSLLVGARAAASVTPASTEELPGVGLAYKIISIGTIPYGNGDPGSGNGLAAQLWMSRTKDLVVDANTGQYWDFSSGTPVETTYGNLPSPWSPQSMNSSGVIVGNTTEPAYTGDQVGGTWYEGTFTQVPYVASTVIPINNGNGNTYTVEGMWTSAAGINDAGEVVGSGDAYCQETNFPYGSGCQLAVTASSAGSTPVIVGAIPEDEIDIDCEFADFYAESLVAVDDNGNAYGTACWSGGNPVEISGDGSPEGLANFPTQAINSDLPAIQQADVDGNGQIATYGHIWDNGGTTTMDGPDGSAIEPLQMNDNEVVVGWDASSHDVIWTPGGSTTLQALSGTQLQLDAVLTGVNDNGDFTGYEQGRGSYYNAFIAVPVVPSITSVTPEGGPMTGGQAVDVLGTGFSVATGVDFATTNGTEVPAQSFRVVDDNEIIAVTPDMSSYASSAVLPAELQVLSPDDPDPTEPPWAPYDFGAPIVTSVAPDSGPLGGGNTVTITGSGFKTPGLTLSDVAFDPASDVTEVDAQDGIDPTVVSDTEIDVTVPSFAGGYGGAAAFLADVICEFSVAGGGSVQAAPAEVGDNQYGFGLPTVSAVVPGGGPLGGGDLVTIEGSGFAAPGLSLTGVSFTPSADGNATGASLQGVDATVVSDTEIVVTSPDATSAAGGASSLDTLVTADFQDATGDDYATIPLESGDDAYAFGAPVISSIEPQGGPVGGGNTVTIVGSGFDNASLSLTGVDFSPAGDGPALNGTDPQVISDTEIEVTAPDATAAAGSAGWLETTVTAQFSDNAAGGGATDDSVPEQAGSNAYSFGLPVIDSVEPGGGPLAGGNTVTITGSGFDLPDFVFTGVDFDAPESASLAGLGTDIVSNTEIQVTAPDATADAAGAPAVDTTVDVNYLDPDDDPVESVPADPGDDSYGFGAPVITDVEPGGGPMGGGNTVKIIGSGFENSALSFAGVTFTPDGGSALDGTSATVVSDSEIDVTAPSATAAAGGDPSLDTTVTADFDESATGTPDNSVASAAGDGTYTFGAPIVTAVEPGGGPMGGGNTVKIIGSGFASSSLMLTGVTFTPSGGSALTGTSATVVSDTEIDVTAPSATDAATGASLTTSVSAQFSWVSSPDQTLDSEAATPASDTYVFGAPVITSVVPAAGPLGGGNTVVISGAGFSDPALTLSGVSFTTSGGTSGQTLSGVSPVVVSDTEITVTAPDATSAAGGAGSVQTTVTAEFVSAGDSGATVSSVAAAPDDTTYSFGAPVISSVAPEAGPLGGGNTIEILGSGFETGGLTLSGVGFDWGGGPALAGLNPTVVSDSEVDVTVPSGFAAADGQPILDTEVTATFSGTAGAVSAVPASSGDDSYEMQTAASIATVTFVHSATNPEVVVSGSGFGTRPTAGPACAANNTDWSNNDLWIEDTSTYTSSGEPGDCIGIKVSTYTDTEIVFTFGSQYKNYPPLAAGDTFQMNVYGATYAATVTYNVPIVTKLSPADGPGAGGNKVTVSGVALAGASSVLFGTTPAVSYTVNSAGTSIVAYPPPQAAAAVTITVTTPGGTSVATPAAQYTYLAPSVTKLSVTSGPGAGGNKVTITGLALNGATSVTFGGTEAKSFTVAASGKSISAVAPAGTAGTVDVTVVTPGGTSALAPADEYTYLAPEVTSVTPSTGSAGGGTQVTVRGADLTGATAVLFGTVAGTIKSVGASSVVVYSPPGSGSVEVTVVTPGGTSAASPAEEFTYT